MDADSGGHSLSNIPTNFTFVQRAKTNRENDPKCFRNQTTDYTDRLLKEFLC